MSWDLFGVVTDNLVNNVFGNYLFLALFLMVSVVLLFMAASVNPVLSFVLGLPFFVAMVGAGWFGGVVWVKSLMIIVAAVIWGFILWRMVE